MILEIATAASSVLLGIEIGKAIRNRGGFVQFVQGPVPHYAVHREAELVAKRLSDSVTHQSDKDAIVAAARRIRVWTSDEGFNPSAPKSRFGRVAAAFTADAGTLVCVQAGEGWEKRLSLVMAHAIRGVVRGNEDHGQADRPWFVAALEPWNGPGKQS